MVAIKMIIILLTGIFLYSCTVTGQWTPEKSDLLFTSNRNGNSEIYLIPAGDTTWINLTNHPSSDNWGVWSPDGKQIVFQTRRNGKFDIYVMNADGSEQRQLTDHEEHDYLPAWTPDGRRISFTSWRIENADSIRSPHFYIMNVDGSDEHRFITGSPQTSTGIRWSPDGERTVFSQKSGDVTAKLLLGDKDGKILSELTGDERYYGGAVFSPDGKWITFYADAGDSSAIGIIGVDGLNQQILVSSGHNWYPSWSPDGSWLVYDPAVSGSNSGDIDIHAVEIGGGKKPLVLVSGPGRETEPMWRPHK